MVNSIVLFPYNSLFFRGSPRKLNLTLEYFLEAENVVDNKAENIADEIENEAAKTTTKNLYPSVDDDVDDVTFL